MTISKDLVYKGNGDGFAEGTFLNQIKSQWQKDLSPGDQIKLKVIYNDSEYEMLVNNSGYILKPVN